MDTVDAALTDLVVTVKTALVAPAATVTPAGTVAVEVLLLDSDTAAPPCGAGALRAIVACTPPPPTTVDGASVTDCSVGTGGGVDVPVTVSVAVRVVPL